MKHVSFLFASLLLLLPQSAFAQPPGTNPDAPVAEPEPEVSDEPEPEVSDEDEEPGEPDADGPDQDPLPEDPTPEPAPNIVHEPEAGVGLGQAVTTPAQESVLADPVVEEAAEEAHAEAVQDDIADDAQEAAEDGGPGEPSTADRLAQANPNSGLPWALPINFSQTLSAWTLSRSAGQTYNPTYGWSFSIIPRWNFDNGLSIGVRQNLDIEWTESDITTGNRYLWWGDTQLDATYTLPWKPLGTMIIPSFLLSAGVSPISRGANRFLGPGGRLLLIKPIPILGGLILGAGASYTYWAGRANGGVRPRGDGYECQRAGTATVPGQPSVDCPTIGGNTPIRHVFSVGFFGTLIPAAGWQINLSFTSINNKGDLLGPACLSGADGVTSADGETICFDDNSRNNHWRYITSFGFSVGYDVTSYMTLSVGYSTLAFYPDAGGNVENPFYNELTQLSLALQFRVDGMVVALKADDAAEEAAEEEAAAEGLRRLAF